MSCISCGNCKQGESVYFCSEKNELVISDQVETTVVEKERLGWKKGDPEYEIHRRKTRKEVEVS